MKQESWILDNKLISFKISSRFKKKTKKNVKQSHKEIDYKGIFHGTKTEQHGGWNGNAILQMFPVPNMPQHFKSL